ncbi:MAG TPA: SGNH/GDSL hydrolase family protein [Elusimicrobiota bacterium]|nr:SGNH/GDSL hydrolase family protein [Elusimicrobiota bacterium]
MRFPNRVGRWILLPYILILLLFLEIATRLSLVRLWPSDFSRFQDSEIRRYLWTVRQQKPALPLDPAERFDPVRGWALRPGVRNDRTGFHSNSRELRGRREYADEKPPHVRRVAVFGDSYAAAAKLSDAETYPARLEHLLPNTEVLNFGVMGYGHDQMLLYLRQEGLTYHPDVVILGFVTCDIPRNSTTFPWAAKPRFRLHGQDLLLENFPVPSPDEIVRWEFFHPKLFRLLKTLFSPRDTPGEWRLTTALLEEFCRVARAAGAAPLVVFMPIHDELSSPDASPAENQLEDHCRSHGIPYFSVRPALAKFPDAKKRFHAGTHWSAEAHALIAGELSAFLRTLDPTLKEPIPHEQRNAPPKTWERRLADVLNSPRRHTTSKLFLQ